MRSKSKQNSTPLSSMFIDESAIPLGCNYLWIHPRPWRNHKKSQQVKPILYFIKTQKTRLEDIYEKIAKNKQIKLLKNIDYRFTDNNGHPLGNQWSIKMLKNHLKVDNINGKELFMEETPQKESVNQENQLIDQCGVIDYVTNFDLQLNPQYYQLNFELQKSECILTTECNFSGQDKSHLQKITNQLLTEIESVFGLTLKQSDIKSLKIKETGVVLSKDILVKINQTAGLVNRSIIKVQLQDNSLKIIPKVMDGKDGFLIYDIENQNYKKFYFSQIKFMTFASIYRLYFGKEVKRNNEMLGLMIGSIIIGPYEKLKNIDKLYDKNGVLQFGVMTLVARVVSQKSIFYKKIENAFKNQYIFAFKEVNIIAHPTKHQQVQNIHKNNIKRKAFQQKQLNQFSYFAVQRTIAPIYYYTAHIRYRETNSQSTDLLYRQLNSFLRNQSIIYQDFSQIKQNWKYKLTNSILKSFPHLQSIKKLVYRGINYDIEKNPGEVIVYNTFLSASEFQYKARGFAMTQFDFKQEQVRQNQSDILNLSREKIKYICLENVYCLLKIHSKNGKSIKRYSLYPDEAQVLFQPYTSFRVISKSMDQYSNCDFLIYELEEIEAGMQIYERKSNFIVWVDSHKEEGKFFHNKIVENYQNSTIFLQLTNNIQLLRWVQAHKQYLKKQESNVVLITNMSREQNGKMNEQAGIETIKIIRSYPETIHIPILVYIYNKQSALAKISRNGLALSVGKLEIVNEFLDVLKFVQKHIDLKFVIGPQKQKQLITPQIISELRQTNFSCTNQLQQCLLI